MFKLNLSLKIKTVKNLKIDSGNFFITLKESVFKKEK